MRTAMTEMLAIVIFAVVLMTARVGRAMCFMTIFVTRLNYDASRIRR
jgi:hypothetical protein